MKKTVMRHGAVAKNGRRGKRGAVYAVVNVAARKTNFYATWADAEQHIKGRPVAHRKFKTQAEAAAWAAAKMQGGDADDAVAKAQNAGGAYPNEARYWNGTHRQEVFMYTDGSDIKQTGKRGFGVALTWFDDIIQVSDTEVAPKPHVFRMSGIYDGNVAAVSNPTVEAMAVKEGIASLCSAIDLWPRHCDKDIAQVVVYTDCDLIVKYIDGRYKPAPPGRGTPHFQKVVREMLAEIENINIKYHVRVIGKHVPAHSGVVLNELADDLAKDRKVFDEISTIPPFPLP